MKHISARLILFSYNTLIVIAAPVLLWRKWRRYRKRKTPHEFDMARWRADFINRPEAADSAAPHVVFVSTGFGEMRVTEQLDAALRVLCPQVRTTWAVRRRETVETIRKEHPQQALAWMPFDFYVPCRNLVRNLQPDVVVMVEKLWVPNLIWAARLGSAKVIAANSTTGNYLSSWFSALNRWTLSGFRTIVLQSNEELAKLRDALPPRADYRIAGTLKTTLSTGEAAENENLQSWLTGHSTPLLAAGSTYADDEELALSAFKKVRESVPSRLLMAPRRLHRVDEVLESCRAHGFSVSRFSEWKQGETVSAEVFLLDTLGDLNAAYRFATAAFIGGTLAGVGHNVLEPVAHGKPVSFGPGAVEAEGESTRVQRECLEAGVGFCVESPEELADHWLQLLQDPQRLDEVKTRSRSLLQKQQNALDENVRAIVECLSSGTEGQTPRS